MVNRKNIEQLHNALSSQLIRSRGFVSEFTNRFNGEIEVDLNCPIELIQDLIDINIKLKTELENYSDVKLKGVDAILSETIEHYYTSLRILKKHNKRNNIPTSQMAIDSCRHSLNTLQTIIDGRRTT
jgi:hypothetical protein